MFYLCSNAIWILFSTCVTRNATTFTGNANVFGKVYFPRLTIPISNMLSAVIQFLVQMTMVMGMLVYYVIQGAVHPQWQLWPLIPIILMHIGLLGLGFGIIISSLTTKYRDLSILVGFGVQLWMYATPIVYPMSQLEEGTLKSLIMINPVSAPVETLRCIILGEGQIMPEYLFLSVLMTVAIVMMGIAIFNKVEKTFMDTV